MTQSVWDLVSNCLNLNFNCRDSWDSSGWIFELPHSASLILTCCWFLSEAHNEYFFNRKKKPCLMEIARDAIIEFNFMLGIVSSESVKDVLLARRICD